MQGHVRKRGKKWCFVLDVGRDPATGKRKQKWFSGYATKKEAQRAMAEKVSEINRGDFIEPAKMTVGEFLDTWLAEEVKGTRSQHSYDIYSGLIRNHIRPGLGNVKLEKLLPVHIQKFFNQLPESGLSSSTANQILMVIKTSLSWAVDMGMISKNPAAKVTPKTQSKQQMKVWTPDEVARFLKMAQTNRYFTAFHLALSTGMRIGEILGLHWEDVDLDDGMIRVRRMLEESSEGSRIVERTKSDAGRRSIALTDESVEVLKRHRATQKEEMMVLGYRSDLVFMNLKGKPISSRGLRYHFDGCIKLAEVPKIRFHDLRHTHATILLQQGVHPKIVQERLGHSSIQMTMDRYSHVTLSMQKEAVQSFGNIIEKG